MGVLFDPDLSLAHITKIRNIDKHRAIVYVSDAERLIQDCVESRIDDYNIVGCGLTARFITKTKRSKHFVPVLTSSFFCSYPFFRYNP